MPLARSLLTGMIHSDLCREGGEVIHVPSPQGTRIASGVGILLLSSFSMGEFGFDVCVPTERREDPKKEKRGGDPKGEVEEKSSEKTRADRLRKRRGESQSFFLLGDADQESETRMSKNALRTGRRQAVEELLRIVGIGGSELWRQPRPVRGCYAYKEEVTFSKCMLNWSHLPSSFKSSLHCYSSLKIMTRRRR
ncbi:hypothetical protein TNCV_1782081 [Trichonephila clavipes]|nr:hypothetical protein TNCV_1782081 [Trichonephila clavipes]